MSDIIRGLDLLSMVTKEMCGHSEVKRLPNMLKDTEKIAGFYVNDITHVIRFTRLSRFFRATLKNWEESGYKASKLSCNRYHNVTCTRTYSNYYGRRVTHMVNK